MVPQLLQFLNEEWKAQSFNSAGPVLKSFIEAEQQRFPSWGPVLLQQRLFKDHHALFAVTMDELQYDVKQLEFHADINLTFSRVQYLAWTGGEYLPLIEMHRRPFIRGIGFEIEEREALKQSIRQGDVHLSDRTATALQHYSTGLGLLAGDDQLAGLLDATFMQFYLAIESILGEHKKKRTEDAGQALFGSDYTPDLEKVVQHVYLARHLYFAHGNEKQAKGQESALGAFSIAKQVLVAKWCARMLLSLASGRPMLIRENRLYSGAGGSMEFRGNIASLSAEFSLK